eukprot:CAMPEP_0175623556 /NCGR_PEP_ID=MMETSP0096-20121207/69491_1 /TAXON_ID=311494 /ORGANISM="Alexandrium monilatum, Strain CCMP3105" /LENGTH=811 /DNA_ID=CAMNT_0016928819 /DNA_START=1 /DNA_END=2432 /DNA_ORIENTATION=+
MILYEPGTFNPRTLCRLSGSCFFRTLPIAILIGGVSSLLELADGSTGFLTGSLDNTAAYNSFSMLCGFLIIFRTQQSYSRFWEGANCVKKMQSEIFVTGSNLVAFCRTSKKSKGDITDFQTTLIRLLSLLHSVACAQLHGKGSLRIESDSNKVLDAQGMESDALWDVEATDSKVELILQWIQSLIVDAHEAGIVNIAPPILSRIYHNLGNMLSAFYGATRLIEVPYPFPYMQTTDLLLIVHCSITPVVMCSFTKHYIWAGIFTFLIELILLCLNMTAVELEDPFGEDLNDLNLHDMQEELNKRLFMLLNPEMCDVPTFSTNALLRNGVTPVTLVERPVRQSLSARPFKSTVQAAAELPTELSHIILHDSEHPNKKAVNDAKSSDAVASAAPTRWQKDAPPPDSAVEGGDWQFGPASESSGGVRPATSSGSTALQRARRRFIPAGAEGQLNTAGAGTSQQECGAQLECSFQAGAALHVDGALGAAGSGTPQQDVRLYEQDKVVQQDDRPPGTSGSSSGARQGPAAQLECRFDLGGTLRVDGPTGAGGASSVQQPHTGQGKKFNPAWTLHVNQSPGSGRGTGSMRQERPSQDAGKVSPERRPVSDGWRSAAGTSAASLGRMQQPGYKADPERYLRAVCRGRAPQPGCTADPERGLQRGRASGGASAGSMDRDSASTGDPGSTDVDKACRNVAGGGFGSGATGKSKLTYAGASGGGLGAEELDWTKPLGGGAYSDEGEPYASASASWTEERAKQHTHRSQHGGRRVRGGRRPGPRAASAEAKFRPSPEHQAPTGGGAVGAFGCLPLVRTCVNSV